MPLKVLDGLNGAKLKMVEVSGFEPLAFSMPLRRATNCAKPPSVNNYNKLNKLEMQPFYTLLNVFIVALFQTKRRTLVYGFHHATRRSR